MTNLVIGGGISGLIWTYYHPEYTIITPEIGGNFGKNNMIWLHDTIETRSILKLLGFVKNEKDFEKILNRSYIGYSIKNEICKKIDEISNEKLIQKKMTKWNKTPDISFKTSSKKMSLSEGNNEVNYMETLNIDLLKFINSLQQGLNIKKGVVTSITDKFIIYKKSFDSVEEEKIYYKNLVSTAPAPIFWKMYGIDKKFKSLPTTDVVTKTFLDFYDTFYEMIYYDNSQPFTRISYMNDKYTIEFTGEIDIKTFQELYPEIVVESLTINKHGRLFENRENIEPNLGIKFLGRFAQWDFRITTEHVINQSMKI